MGSAVPIWVRRRPRVIRRLSPESTRSGQFRVIRRRRCWIGLLFDTPENFFQLLGHSVDISHAVGPEKPSGCRVMRQDRGGLGVIGLEPSAYGVAIVVGAPRELVTAAHVARILHVRTLEGI